MRRTRRSCICTRVGGSHCFRLRRARRIGTLASLWTSMVAVRAAARATRTFRRSQMRMLRCRLGRPILNVGLSRSRFSLRDLCCHLWIRVSFLIYRKYRLARINLMSMLKLSSRMGWVSVSSQFLVTGVHRAIPRFVSYPNSTIEFTGFASDTARTMTQINTTSFSKSLETSQISAFKWRTCRIWWVN